MRLKCRTPTYCWLCDAKLNQDHIPGPATSSAAHEGHESNVSTDLPARLYAGGLGANAKLIPRGMPPRRTVQPTAGSQGAKGNSST